MGNIVDDNYSGDPHLSDSFAQRYPTIDHFVDGRGWIEIGYDDFSNSFVRALDIGGLVWEGRQSYDSLDDALVDLEAGLTAWARENGIEIDNYE
jgi:hypothetical protein